LKIAIFVGRSKEKVVEAGKAYSFLRELPLDTRQAVCNSGKCSVILIEN
jgi:hypothetical protein